MNISDKIKYIGVDDTTIDLFESQYAVPDGVSYNSYVILDDKTAIMDTVDKRGMKDWENNLLNALDGRNADYVIIQHMEPDHAGSLARLIELFPEITVVGNAKTFVMINQFFENINIKNSLTVKEGDTLNLGSHTLTFVMAPMVHWPEVMVTYESSEKVLFSADGFGKFGALSLTENADWACEARRYYFNIVGKYGAPVQTLLKKASALDIKTICPLHGPVLSDNLGYYLDLYNTWSSYQPESKGVFIAYASIHGNTAYAAEQFAEMLRNKGVDNVVITDLSRCDIAEAVKDAFRYDRMVLAAASYDAGVFPIMQDFLHHLQAKAFQNRKKLSSVVIGANVTKIGAKAFYKDAKLKNITFKGNKAVKAGKNAFKGIKANAKVTVPYKISKKNLNKIKKAVKSAGKKVVIKKKDIIIPY